VGLVVVGIGGTTRDGSSTQRALEVALAAAAAAGAETALLTASDLDLPMFSPESRTRTDRSRRLVLEVQRADGVIVASPGYHGTISGLVKNALDYLEDLRDDPRPYLDGRAVGTIATALGWQASVSTLAALRSIAPSLRGWPTPMGAALNTRAGALDDDGNWADEAARFQLETVGRQVVEFARMRQAGSD
jgi:FMN reductase